MKWVKRSLIAIVSLAVAALIGFQVFKNQIAEVAFRKAIGQCRS